MSELKITGAGHGSVNEPLPEDEILPGVAREDLEVMLAILTEVAGGDPGIGYNEFAKTWAVAPACRCPSCKEFTEQYQVIGAASPIRAIRIYMDAWSAYEMLVEKSKGLH